MERNYCFNCAWMRFSPMDPMGCVEFYVCTNPHLQKPEERDPVTGDLLAAATTERLCAVLRSDAEDPTCPHYRKAAPVESPDQLPPVVRVEQLEALNRELLDVIEGCCLISKPENRFRPCRNYVHMSGGSCWNLRTDRCCIWATVNKVKGSP